MTVGVKCFRPRIDSATAWVKCFRPKIDSAKHKPEGGKALLGSGGETVRLWGCEASGNCTHQPKTSKGKCASHGDACRG
jgi:hypothetical protein